MLSVQAQSTVQQLLHAQTWPFLFKVALLGVLAALFHNYVYGRRTPKMRVVGVSPGPLQLNLAAANSYYDTNGLHVYQQHYCENKHEPFYFQSVDRVVVPPETLRTIAKLPPDVLSGKHSICERHLGRYTGIEFIKTDSTHVNVTRGPFTQNLGCMIPQLHEELLTALASRSAKLDIPGSVSAGQTLPAFPLAFSLVTAVTSRAFVGPRLCREPSWLQTFVNLPPAVNKVATALRRYPKYLQPVVASFSTCTAELARLKAGLYSVLSNEIKQRIDLDQRKANLKEPSEEEDYNLLQMLIEDNPFVAGNDFSEYVRFVGDRMIVLAMAALFTTSIAAHDILLELAARREVQGTLRSEMQEINPEKGGWTKEKLQSLDHLDSFMKESQRVNPMTWGAVFRKTMQPVVLSPGVEIPAGYIIVLPSAGMLTDSEVYSSPENFDADRFYKLKQQSDTSGREYNFAGTGPTLAPMWGAGKWACPGRFYADYALKLIIVGILECYDMALPEGRTKRLEVHFEGDRMVPDKREGIVLTRI